MAEIDDKQKWERDCLAAVQCGFSDQSEREFGKQVTGIWLEGEYPDTKLLVSWERLDGARKITLDFDMWGEDFESFGGGRDSPATVALIVHSGIAAPSRFPYAAGA